MNEKTKKEGYTDQLNQELLGTLGEKASSEQISAAYEKERYTGIQHIIKRIQNMPVRGKILLRQRTL